MTIVEQAPLSIEVCVYCGGGPDWVVYTGDRRIYEFACDAHVGDLAGNVAKRGRRVKENA